MTAKNDTVEACRELYLDLMKRVLTGALSEDNDTVLNGVRHQRPANFKQGAALTVGTIAARLGYEISYKRPYSPELRELGRDTPSRSDTMIGLRRMNNLQFSIEAVLRDEVPGDLIETGVWRGGATIFMRAVLKAFGDTTRKVWVADSFEGLPPPDPSRYPADAANPLDGLLRVGADQVRHNFARYGLLDDQVQFLVGWFKDTLPTSPVRRLAVLRLDGDMYESTWQAVEALYPRLSPGGFCIVDDYGSHASQCGRAIDEYRAAHGITEEIVDIDGYGVYWRKRP